MSQDVVIVQHWEGLVEEVCPETFWARLIPIIGEGPEVAAEIKIEEINEDELEFIKPGAIFDWVISRDSLTGEGEGKIEFRKEFWTQEQLEESKIAAKKLRKHLHEMTQEDGECKRLI
jgi:hypothetical protein